MIIVILLIFGLALGSFVNALVWRLHEQEQLATKKSSTKRLQYGKDLSIVSGRSMCTYCHHTLAVKDLIPLFSWLSLGGKCRYCRKSISWQYPLVEALTAALFLVSYYYWPSGFSGVYLASFICWLIFMTGFMALAVYDLRWFLLPNRIVFPLLLLGIVQVLFVSLCSNAPLTLLLGSLFGVLIGGGLFYILFQLSGGTWIGGGDVKLGALLGLLVGGPMAACLLLFVASLIGTIVSVPLLASGRAKRTSLVPFGPFLIIAAILVRLFGAGVIVWLRQRAYLPPA